METVGHSGLETSPTLVISTGVRPFQLSEEWLSVASQ